MFIIYNQPLHFCCTNQQRLLKFSRLDVGLDKVPSLNGNGCLSIFRHLFLPSSHLFLDSYLYQLYHHHDHVRVTPLDSD